MAAGEFGGESRCRTISEAQGKAADEYGESFENGAQSLEMSLTR
jgi:hypothetical protein